MIKNNFPFDGSASEYRVASEYVKTPAAAVSLVVSLLSPSMSVIEIDGWYVSLVNTFGIDTGVVLSNGAIVGELDRDGLNMSSWVVFLSSNTSIDVGGLETNMSCLSLISMSMLGSNVEPADGERIEETLVGKDVRSCEFSAVGATVGVRVGDPVGDSGSLVGVSVETDGVG